MKRSQRTRQSGPSDVDPAGSSLEPGTRHGDQNLRIDPAHVPCEVAPQDIEAMEPDLAAIESNLLSPAGEAALEHVRLQAAQLAVHLQKQQATLDHREAELNSRAAAVESQVRGARIWLNERQQALTSQRAELEQYKKTLESQAEAVAADQRACQEMRETAEQELVRRKVEIEDRGANLTGQPDEAGNITGELELLRVELLKRHQTLVIQSGQLDQRQIELDLRQQQLEETAERLAAQIALGEHADPLQPDLLKLEARRQQLDHAESLLASQEAEMDARRRDLVLEREAATQEIELDRRRLAAERQQANEALEKEKEMLNRYSDDLDARRVALNRLRSEATQSRREALEMRLATEELWARLSGAMTPAALTQSLAQLRIKLADQQRLAMTEIAEQKTELAALAKRLSEQHDKLSQQKHEVQAWTTGRQAEIEHQAARLVAREQQLDDQEQEFQRAFKNWDAERQSYQREIRRLLGQLRRTNFAA